MKDKREIVLFFKPNMTLNLDSIALELKSHLDDKKIGDPVIFEKPSSKKNPIIVFDQNEDLIVQVSLLSTSIIITEDFYEEMDTIIFDIIDSFDACGVSFIRMGYVANVFLNQGAISRAKEKYLNLENIESLEEINIGLYCKVDTKYGKINAWHRMITDQEAFKGLLCQFDFNSLITEEINIDMKYIKEFIKVTEEFIESRIDV